MRLLRISQKCFTEITARSKNNIKIDDGYALVNSLSVVLSMSIVR
jgi:hypothetical protein